MATIGKSLGLLNRNSFTDLGIHGSLCKILKDQFQIQKPLNSQKLFIPAVMTGSDVVIRDSTVN
jgi:superfamily II DNA/RNA helicase